MNTRQLEDLIKRSLDDFYARRLARLEKLRLRETLKRKNPYLMRAVGLQNASEIVANLLSGYVSASDEGIFGDAFFEPIARIASRGQPSPSEGVDVVIQRGNRYLAVAVKSGPNIFNSSQKKRQNQEFLALRSRLLKMHRQFDALLGHCYGQLRSEPGKDKVYRDRSGQEFWEEITGDRIFYLKLVRLMRDHPLRHRKKYEHAFHKALNRFTREFLLAFCHDDGAINWEKLVKFNSGSRPSD